MYVNYNKEQGRNRVKVFVNKMNYHTGIVYDSDTKKVLWVTQYFDLRKLKRRMRRAGWIK